MDGRTVARAGGNVAAYFCTPELEVVHALAGPVRRERFLEEARWAVETLEKARESTGGDREKLVAEIRRAHQARSPKPFGTCAALDSTIVTPFCPGELQGIVLQPAVTTLEWKPGIAAVEHRALYRNVEAAEPLPMLQDEVRAQALAGVSILLTLGGGRDLHPLLAEKGLPKLDEVYAHVFQNVLGERLSDQPVREQEMRAARTLRVPEPDAALRREVEDLRRQVAELRQKLEAKSKVY